MIRLLLPLLNAPLFILLLIICVGIQTSLFASYPLLYLQPDIILLAVIWCALRRNFTEGGILTLLFAYIGELHSAAPQGALFISYMTLYLCMKGLSRLLVVPNPRMMVVLTLGASVFWKFVNSFILQLLGAPPHHWQHTLVLLFPGAVMAGTLGVWVYRGLNKLDWITHKNPKARNEMAGEIHITEDGDA